MVRDVDSCHSTNAVAAAIHAPERWEKLQAVLREQDPDRSARLGRNYWTLQGDSAEWQVRGVQPDRAFAIREACITMWRDAGSPDEPKGPLYWIWIRALCVISDGCGREAFNSFWDDQGGVLLTAAVNEVCRLKSTQLSRGASEDRRMLELHGLDRVRQAKAKSDKVANPHKSHRGPYSLEGCAEAVGLSSKWVGLWARGTKKASPRQARALAAHLGCEVEDLLKRS